MHRRIEILLEGTVGDHAEGIEVAEVEIPAIESACAVRRAAEGAVRIQPAVGGNVEPRPVVVAHVGGAGIEPCLPLGRNACAAAERDEGDGVHAAVTALTGGEILRNVHLGEIRRNEAVDRLRRAVIVEAARDEQGIVLAPLELSAQRTDEGREADVRQGLLECRNSDGRKSLPAGRA